MEKQIQTIRKRVVVWMCLALCSLSVFGQEQIPTLQELVNRKQFAAAVARAGSLTPADSADYATMSAIGQAYEGLLQYRDAYACYQYCYRMDTTSYDALSSVARMAMNLGKASVAQDCFQKVLQNDSTDFFANYQLGRLYVQLGDYENAIRRFDVLRNQDTAVVNPVIYRNLADCYMKINAIDSATICYFQAHDANRENAGLASALVNCLLRQGGPNVLDAIEVCDTALYYNPGNHALMGNKAMAYYMNKNYEEADSIYEVLLAEKDSSFFTLKYGGAARYLSERAFDAIPLLEKAYLKDTADVETTLLLGAALGKTYDRKRALELFDRAEQLMRPNEALANMLLFSRGETLWADGQGYKADAMFYKAWLENKDRLDLLFRIDRQYGNWGVVDYGTDERKSRALFIKNLFLNECFRTRRKTEGFHAYRRFLQYMYEEAFFQNKKELEMIAPNGKRSKLAVEDLKTLIDRLPEIPANEKKFMDEMDAAIKKSREMKKNGQTDTALFNAGRKAVQKAEQEGEAKQKEN